MHVGVVTIFPELFSGFVSTSLLGAAVDRGLLSVTVEDLRRFAEGRHRSVDDVPYGGGGGMAMMSTSRTSHRSAASSWSWSTSASRGHDAS